MPANKLASVLLVLVLLFSISDFFGQAFREDIDRGMLEAAVETPESIEVDYVMITDEIDGDVLKGGYVPPGYKEWGYLSAYNYTHGFVDNYYGNWDASGDATLTLGEYGPHNEINVGETPGDVWFNVTDDDGHHYGVRYTVITDEVDHIRITEFPGGTPLDNRTVTVETQIRGYCSVYNESSGYLYTVEGNWSAEGADSELLENVTNESNVIDVGSTGGLAWFNLSYEGFHHSVRIEVLTPTVDHLNITDTPGGVPLVGGEVQVGYRIWGNASAYNETAGYIGTVDGEWMVEYETGMDPSIGPSLGETSWLNVGHYGGNLTWKVSYYEDENWYNDSVDFYVEPPTLDYINITSGGEEINGGIVPVNYTLDVELSAYNRTSGFIFLVHGNWEVEGGDAHLLNGTTGKENTINAGTLSGKVWLNASYDGLKDQLLFTVDEPKIDYIDFLRDPDDPHSVVGNKSVSVGYEFTIYGVGYNETVGLVDLVSLEWSVDNSEGAEAQVEFVTGTHTVFSAGTSGGISELIGIYTGTVSHSVLVTIEAPDIDRIEITDVPGGAPVEGGNVPVGTMMWGNASAYNGTAGFVETVEAQWTAEYESGMDPTLGPSLAESSWLEVGHHGGNLTWIVVYQKNGDMYIDSVDFVVDPPEVDQIRFIRDPGDPHSVVHNKSVSAGYESNIYGAGYNETVGFYGVVSLRWSVDNFEGAEARIDPEIGDQALFSAGPNGGEARLTGVYEEMLYHSITFNIEPPEIDSIRIRDEPDGGGNELGEITLGPDDDIVMYAAAYNDTYGYQEDVYVSWILDDQAVGRIQEDHGTSTLFTAVSIGVCNVTAQYEELRYTLGVTVIYTHTPVITGKIPDIELEKNFGVYEIDLMEHASDEYDSHLDMRWYLTGVDLSIISIYGENQTGNHVITLLSREKAHGSMQVRYWLVNSAGNKASQSAWINVTYIYNPPRFRRCPDLYVRFDEPYEFNYAPYIVYDEDRKHELGLKTDDQEHTSVKGLTVIYEYPESMLDEEVLVIITVSDDIGSDYTAISVTVSSNFPPETVNRLPDLEIKQWEVKENVFNLDDYFADPEGEPLYMSYGYTYLSITIHGDHTVDVRADTNWHGVERVTFRAKDPMGAIIEQTINITIIPVNFSPEFKELPRFVIYYEEEYTFDLRYYISDRDNQIQELTITTCSPEYVTVEGTTLNMWYPKRMSDDLYQNYTVPLEVFVSDGIDTVSRVTTVTVGEIYPPELMYPLHDVAFRENEKLINAFNLDNHFWDRQNDTMYYSSGNEYVEVVIHDNSSVDFYAPRNWNGQELITIRATNSAGALMEDSLTVTVIPVNNPPMIAGTPRQEGMVDRSWILDMGEYISDVDNETHELTLFVDDPNVQVVRHKLIFHYHSAGTYYVTVEVSDGMDTNTTEIEVLVRDEDRRFSPILLSLLLIPLFAILWGVFHWLKKKEFTVEDIFLIHDSGVLIKHHTRTLKAKRDEDILAGMFLAVNNFVEDAFGGEEKDTLKRMEYGDHIVLVHKGRHVILAVFLSGEVPPRIFDSMSNLVKDIEERYKGRIEEWSGDLEHLPGVDEMLSSILDSKGKYGPGDWKKEHNIKDKIKNQHFGK
ncbi:MAG: hypothetical protein R6U17_00855 [Thermoplasmata archaeon]